MRTKLIENDYVDTVIGLGPNLFYNSPMDSCIVVCRKNKPEVKRNKIMFIRAYDQTYKEGNQNFLSEQHISTIFEWYSNFKDIPGRVKIADIEDVRRNNHIINVALYARPEEGNSKSDSLSTELLIKNWMKSSDEVKNSFSNLRAVLKEVLE
jgi:type I restriction enzyme M protein